MRRPFDHGFDLAVVGAGILGLAHAMAAARLGKRVIVIERDAQANRASVRNFGFVTVTGQAAGETWHRARRSRDIWADVAPKAGIAIDHEGLLLLTRRNQSRAVIEAFLASNMAEGCALLEPAALTKRFPQFAGESRGALWSPHELRVESRLAIPKLAAWLAAAHGVTFLTATAVHAVAPPIIETSRGQVQAEVAVVCPGDDLVTLFPDLIEAHGVRRCRLSMLRLADPGFRLPAGVMSDLGLTRYAGYASLVPAGALLDVLRHDQAAALDHGVHLIVVQSADGTLVVGDSHHYAETPAPFAAAETEALILEEFEAALGIAPPAVIERWTGTYSSAPGQSVLIEAPSDAVRLAMITVGAGASIGFAVGEDVINGLFGHMRSAA